MAPHSSTLAWKIPWAEEPGGLQSMGSQRVRHDWATSLSRIWEGNGNPLQCSCLENPRGGGAWWAAVYGVTQSRIRLKWCSSSFQESASSDFKKSSAIFLIKISSYFSALWNTKTPCLSYSIIIYIILPCIILNCFYPSYDEFIWTSFYTIDMRALNIDFLSWIEYSSFVSAYRELVI